MANGFDRTQGQNILLAQYLFLGLYLIHQAILLIIYREAKVSHRSLRFTVVTRNAWLLILCGSDYADVILGHVAALRISSDPLHLHAPTV